MEIDDFLGEDASEGELAACGLLIELLSTAGTLTLLAQLRIAELAGPGASEEDALHAVTRRYMDLAVPPLAEKGVAQCLRATSLIGTIREVILEGMEWEATERARLNLARQARRRHRTAARISPG